jgi:hypothetical protein
MDDQPKITPDNTLQPCGQANFFQAGLRPGCHCDHVHWKNSHGQMFLQWVIRKTQAIKPAILEEIRINF